MHNGHLHRIHGNHIDECQGPNLPLLEIDDETEVSGQEAYLSPGNANFQSELTYDGYHSIADYDNDVYESRDAEMSPETNKELYFSGRPVDPNAGEEDLIDPQENRR